MIVRHTQDAGWSVHVDGCGCLFLLACLVLVIAAADALLRLIGG